MGVDMPSRFNYVVWSRRAAGLALKSHPVTLLISSPALTLQTLFRAKCLFACINTKRDARFCTSEGAVLQSPWPSLMCPNICVSTCKSWDGVLHPTIPSQQYSSSERNTNGVQWGCKTRQLLEALKMDGSLYIAVPASHACASLKTICTINTALAE